MEAKKPSALPAMILLEVTLACLFSGPTNQTTNNVTNNYYAASICPKCGKPIASGNTKSQTQPSPTRAAPG